MVNKIEPMLPATVRTDLSLIPEKVNLVSLTTMILSALTDLAGHAGMIVLYVLFILSEYFFFDMKLRKLFKAGKGYQAATGMVRKITHKLMYYLKIKTVVSLATALLSYSIMTAVGLDFAVLWALLIFLLNFIPTIGSIIAAFPVLLLAMLSLDPVLLLMIMALYLAVNTVVGNFIEPVWMGEEVGLATLIVFLSMVFWGWMFGPVGMLLSVPLTIAVKFLSSRNPHTLWLAALLSNKVEETTVSATPGAAD